MNGHCQVSSRSSLWDCLQQAASTADLVSRSFHDFEDDKVVHLPRMPSLLRPKYLTLLREGPRLVHSPGSDKILDQ